jgi:DNA-binding IclR family transcriptional regulator
MGTEIKTRSKTTETSFEIVEAIRGMDGATIPELSERVGPSESTIHRHLVSLREYDYVVRRGNEYHVGLRFLTFGGYAQQQVTAYPMIKEKVDQLAAETGERAQFIVEEHGRRVYLYTEVGESAVQTGAHIGRRGPLHTSAAGKCILANLPDDRIDEIVDEHGLCDGECHSISTREELTEALAQIRERGYAFNKQETTEGVHAVGAPVLDNDDEVVGALSISGPSHRLKGDRLVDTGAEHVLTAANELELHITHSV